MQLLPASKWSIQLMHKPFIAKWGVLAGDSQSRGKRRFASGGPGRGLGGSC
jgi:hypothetical protein